jgi:MFS family permease
MKHAGLFTIVMALATFVVVIDNTIMNVSINALVRDLNTTISGVQAAISLNALIMAAFVLMGGKLADIFGI